MKERQDYICPTCGGTDIEHDLIGRWDKEKEDWIVTDFIEHAPEFCHDCGDRINALFGVPNINMEH